MILSQIEHYWTGRAEGYSQVNQHELIGCGFGKFPGICRKGRR